MDEHIKIFDHISKAPTFSQLELIADQMQHSSKKTYNEILRELVNVEFFRNYVFCIENRNGLKRYFIKRNTEPREFFDMQELRQKNIVEFGAHKKEDKLYRYVCGQTKEIDFNQCAIFFQDDQKTQKPFNKNW